MGMSENVGAYADIEVVLSTALTNGGATYACTTPGQAIRFCQRAYFYRKLLHRVQARQLATILDTRPTSTAYDAMILRREGDTVDIRCGQPLGTLLDGEGNVLELPDPVPTTRHELADIELDQDALDTLDIVQRDLGLEPES